MSVVSLFAQNNNFPYQVVVRDNNNWLVSNQVVGVRISLLRDLPNGMCDYAETHTVQTDINGLATLVIGKGNVVSGVMANVDWFNHAYYLKSEFDITGGNNYTVTGTQLVSVVPLAQYAANVNYYETQTLSISNDTIFLTGDTNSFVKLPAVNIHIPDSVSSYINDVGYITADSFPTYVSYFVNDVGYITSYIDSQQLSLAGDTLKIERGGSVILPMSCCSLAVAVNMHADSLGGVLDSLGDIVSMLESIVCPPNVVTDLVTAISTDTAVCGGTVTSPCGYPITKRGVCWNTAGTADLTDSNTSDGTGVGSFTSVLTGLTPNTTYYVRAYAISGNDTVYGANSIFTTQIPLCYDFLDELTDTLTVCGGVGSYSWRGRTLTSSGIYYDSLKTSKGGCDSVYKLNLTISSLRVKDCDGNVYRTVQIGRQCWLKENLKVKHYDYAGAPSITEGSVSSTTAAYYYHPDGNSANDSIYGLLYNWFAATGGAASSNAKPSGVQGICPQNWHVPSDAEWTELTDTLSGNSIYWCDNNSTYIAMALASKTSDWSGTTTQCAVGENTSANDAAGFSALPSGYYYGSIKNFGKGASFWSTTKFSYVDSYNRAIKNDQAVVFKYGDGDQVGYSVRCIKDY